MNYRLGFFGFSAFAENLTDTVPNVGLLDHRLAVQWIQDHVASFGGNPGNTTLFSESDGATSVGLHVTAYGGTQPAPSRRAIMQSSSATADPGMTSNQTWVNTQELTQLFNCSNPDDDLTASITCLRDMTLDQMLPAEINLTLAQHPFSGLDVFFPVVDQILVPASPPRLLLHGNFSKNISIINGWNDDDGSLFIGSLPQSFSMPPTLAHEYSQISLNLDIFEVENVLSAYPPK